MTSTLVSRRDVDRAIAAALHELGYRKAAGAQGFFLKPMRENVNGWVSYFTQRTPGGEIEITPTVGVRHERIHELIDRLQSRRRDPSEPTATIILGYLMPQNTANVVWRFEAETSVAEQARNLAEHVVRYGEPWVRERASEIAIIDEVRTDRQIHPREAADGALARGVAQGGAHSPQCRVERDARSNRRVRSGFSRLRRAV